MSSQQARLRLHSFEMAMGRLVEFGGNVRLPLGYTFCPTDEVLVNYYLKKKALGKPFTVEVIPDFDVFKADPWDLPSGGRVFKDKKFFFCNTKDHVFENIEKRPAGCGQWRSIGKSKDFEVRGSNHLSGRRNKLIFWKKKDNFVVKTNWVMHEFRMVFPATPSNPSQMSNWAVYRIYQKNKKKRKDKMVKESNGEASTSNDVERPDDVKPSVIDFTMECGRNSGPPSLCTTP